MSIQQLDAILARFGTVAGSWTSGTSLQTMRETLDSFFLSYDLRPGTEVVPLRASVEGEWVTALEADRSRAILLLHGGGYMMGSAHAHRAYASWLSEATGARVLTLDYRLAPEHPYPAALEDAIAGYRALVDAGYGTGSISVCGDSAGGGLTVALLVALRNAREMLPVCAVLVSPWANLACSGASYTANAAIDPIATSEGARMMARAYLGDSVDPNCGEASPIYADLHGLPPIFVLSGEREIFLDDSRSLARNVQACGGQIEWRIWPGMIHQFPIHVGVLDESAEALAAIANFTTRHFAEA